MIKTHVILYAVVQIQWDCASAASWFMDMFAFGIKALSSKQRIIFMISDRKSLIMIIAVGFWSDMA